MKRQSSPFSFLFCLHHIIVLFFLLQRIKLHCSHTFLCKYSERQFISYHKFKLKFKSANLTLLLNIFTCILFKVMELHLV